MPHVNLQLTHAPIRESREEDWGISGLLTDEWTRRQAQ